MRPRGWWANLTLRRRGPRGELDKTLKPFKDKVAEDIKERERDD
jgi:hypothetical protein